MFSIFDKKGLERRKKITQNFREKLYTPKIMKIQEFHTSEMLMKGFA